MPEFTLRYPVDKPVISQPFGVNWTGDPNFYKRFGLPAHEGVDFDGDEGDPIYAAADGVVKLVAVPGRNVARDHPYGKHVRLVHRHGEDEYETIYAHLSQIANSVIQGREVKAGSQLGKMGKTGNTKGVHLHLTLKKCGATVRRETNYPKDVIDPTPFLPPLD